MSIDPQTEQLVAYTDGRRIQEEFHLPYTPSRSVIYQWVNQGRTSRVTGRREYLERFQAGGRDYTSLEAVGRFFAKLNGEAG